MIHRDMVERILDTVKKNKLLLLLPFTFQAQAGALPSDPAPGPAAAIPAFAKLARQKPQQCAADAQPLSAPAGWREENAVCAWQGHLKMRRWASSAPATPACVSAPAAWWAWRRQASGVPERAGIAWNAAWRSRHVFIAMDGYQQVLLVESGADNAWLATEWTWTPSPRPATRDWQKQRWQLLTGSVATRGTAADTESAADETALLRRAWEKNLRGRAGEITENGWLWKSAGFCMRFGAAAPAPAQLPLPYAREDARLEQRAAMQIQLARRYPDAAWPVPFRLLDLPGARSSSGAKYEAIWSDQTGVSGQLWIPTKKGGMTVRALLRASAPQGQAEAAVGAIASELEGIARIWITDHE